MKQVIVGVYEIGSEQAQLVLREGTGGDFYTVPESGSLPRIKVGADTAWNQVVSSLLHEALEFSMTRLGCRYDPCDDHGRDHSSYLFVMTHPQFSNVCGRVATFATDCVPDLSRAWAKWKKNSKLSRKRKPKTNK